MTPCETVYDDIIFVRGTSRLVQNKEHEDSVTCAAMMTELTRREETKWSKATGNSELGSQWRIQKESEIWKED